jgi:FAD:protein FMN transferase
MNRRSFLGKAGLGAIAPMLLPIWGGAARRRAQSRGSLIEVRRRSWAMGQAVSIQLYHESESAGLEAAARALAELRRVEARLSRFDEASDLCELNRRAGRGPIRVDRDLLAVLAAAEALRGPTGGAFDPAVEPLLRVWGFREPRSATPGARELAAARDAVRAARVTIRGDQVSLASREASLDLGGIGVGYGLDCAARVLRSLGVERALVDVSGDCVVLGAPPGEAGWAIGVADPADRARVASRIVVRDRALATSSNRVQTVELSGVRRGHVMDPASGYPANGLAQVTVVARSGLLADVLSTAMLVNGEPAEGVERFLLLGGRRAGRDSDA